jgi:plasmid stabilization system protein ParE
MSAYALTPLAKADLHGIWSYIAKHSEQAANRVEQANDGCACIAEGPLRGHTRSRPLLICAVESAARKRGLTTLSPPEVLQATATRLQWTERSVPFLEDSNSDRRASETNS